MSKIYAFKYNVQNYTFKKNLNNSSEGIQEYY